jgi:hypothetical protein
MFHLDLLEERGAVLGEPYTRQLAVFTKTRMRETAEVERLAAALGLP